MTNNHTLTRRTLVASLAALALPLRTHAAGQSVRFVTPYGYDMTFYETLVAQSAGLFAGQGLDVRIAPGQNAVQGLQQVLSGQADLTRTVGLNLLRAAANEGAPLVSVAVLVPGPFLTLYSHAERPILGADDLPGKRIGIVAPRGATDVVLDLMLADAGLPPSAVTREIVPDAGGSFALIEAGRIDGWIGGPTTLHRAQAAGFPVTGLRIDDGVPPQVLVTTPQVLEQRFDALVGWIRAIRAAVDMVEAQDEASTLALLQGFDIPALADREIALADLALSRSLLGPGRKVGFANDPDQWASAIDRMTRAGLMQAIDPLLVQSNALIDAT